MLFFWLLWQFDISVNCLLQLYYFPVGGSSEGPSLKVTFGNVLKRFIDYVSFRGCNVLLRFIKKSLILFLQWSGFD